MNFEDIKSQEDLDKFLQQESDRRVTQALETAKNKWEQDLHSKLELQKQQITKELEDRAKLSAEELAQKEFESKLSQLGLKESELKRKENILNAHNKFAEAGLIKDDYSDMLDTLVSDDETKTSANIESFINIFNRNKTAIETKVKAEYSKIPHPNKGDGTPEGVTKESFNKMTYQEKMSFKTEHPDEFKSFIGM